MARGSQQGAGVKACPILNDRVAEMERPAPQMLEMQVQVLHRSQGFFILTKTTK